MIIRFEDARREMGKALRKNKALRKRYVSNIAMSLYNGQTMLIGQEKYPYPPSNLAQCHKLAEGILKLMFEEKEK